MSSFLSLLGVLTMVVLILFLAWAATRWIGTHSVPGLGAVPGGGGKLRLLGQLAVGRNERLVVVRLERRCYLLGVTEHGITLLRELEDDEAAPWLDGESEERAPFADTFADMLRRSAPKFKHHNE